MVEERVMDATAEAWRQIALYLAECHAANGEYDAMLSSTSKSRRKRFLKICENAADMIRKPELVVGNRIEEDTLRRLDDLARRQGAK